MQSFDIFLPSNTSVEGNKTNSFTVRLPRPLEFSNSNKWEVALSSITYSRSWPTLGTIDQQFIEIIWQKGGHDQILLDKTLLKNPNDLEKIINTKLKNYYKYFRTVIEKPPEKGKTEPIFEEFQESVEGHEALKLVFNPTESIFEFSINKKWVDYIQLSSQLQYTMGFHNNILKNAVCKADFEPDLTGGYSLLHVYAPGLIEPVVVGDTTCPLLRLVTVKGQMNDIVEEVFLNPQYRGLLSKTIKEISIEIRTASGDLVPFQYGQCLAVLNFRKQPLI